MVSKMLSSNNAATGMLGALYFHSDLMNPRHVNILNEERSI